MSTESTDNTLFSKYYDLALTTILRAHQLRAVQFLVPRLLGQEVSSSGDATVISSEAEDCDIPLTGAILADDMGTGKTLTALAVLWCLCRHGKGKGVIVCPSTLVDNWKAEIKKWFPKTLDRTGLFINGSNRSRVSGSDSVIEQFATAHPAMRPLLVLSYDMFRIYADVLNDVTSFNTIICDEGHRLKNAVGTKTTLALGNCCAMQRLVLTGTPIQNNLNELYAVVQFAAPGYLGDLKEYQTKYSDPISKNSLSSPVAKAAKDKLRAKLKRILLRRDRDAILKAVLPPRVVTKVICRMSGSQREAYETECALLTNTTTPSDADGDGEVIDFSELGKPGTGVDMDEGQSAPVSKKARTESPSADHSNGNMMVLSKLLSLRQLCSSPLVETNNSTDLDMILEKSVKLRFLDAFLSEMRKTNPTERVVVVSNFISTLDIIHLLARRRRYLTLRLDGDVAADKRQNIVNHFNNPKEPFFLMLLSAKAGGVGLNLIGATRLVLWEPDWNPSTDEQAMGRIWRDGQTRKVFIYRLISENSIEETILQRQKEKNTLHSVIKEVPDSANSPESKMDNTPRKRGFRAADSIQSSHIVPVSALGGMILPFAAGCGRGFDKLAGENHSDDLLLSLIAVNDSIFGEDMS